MIDVLVVFLVCGISYGILKMFRDEHSAFKFKFKFFIFYFLASLISALVWPLFLLRPKNVLNIHIATRIMKHITKIYGLKWELRNGVVLAEDRGAVIVSNHQSSLDILGMFNIWEVAGKMTAIAKKEIFYVWPFGLAAYLAGVVFIDRRDARGAYRQLELTSKLLVQQKTKMWLFPEGTRNKDYTKLLPFKKGAFVTAVHAQVPILPVLFSPYYFINRKKYIFNSGHVIIQCLEPVPTTGMTIQEVPALMERVYNLMQAAYVDLSKEVQAALPDDYPYTSVG